MTGVMERRTSGAECRLPAKALAQPTEGGLPLGLRLRLPLTPSLFRTRETGRKGVA
jgi:hypothetical protein